MAWRDTALPTKIMGVDGRALFPFAVWAFHWSWPTFYISLGGVFVFAVMQFFNVSLLTIVKGAPRLFTENKRSPVPLFRYFRRFYRD